MSIENEFNRKLSRICQDTLFIPMTAEAPRIRPVIEKLFATATAKLLSELEQ